MLSAAAVLTFAACGGSSDAPSKTEPAKTEPAKTEPSTSFFPPIVEPATTDDDPDVGEG